MYTFWGRDTICAYQHSLDSSYMFFHSLSKDKYAIEIDHYYTFHYKVLEDIVHHCLECG